MRTNTRPLPAVAAALLCLVLALPCLAAEKEHEPGEFDFRIPKGIADSQVKLWIKQAAAKYGIDRALLQALVEVESGGDAQAVSPKGAQGMTQIMPGTAQDLGLKDAFDPAANIDAGCRYLKEQIKAFGDVRLALAAYNAGPEAVRRSAGIPPIPETQKYVASVSNRYIVLKTGKNLFSFSASAQDLGEKPKK
ncbi:lytic transglycosylase domain-containing protein [Fundidesulfovibrio agrisoli]|uniref:lytic transglycosylase domain-containing protein n=1 Tax=Fundidesulfovibrio agrisoli TaxID=2922717 RepID=UPI001FAE468D|nr:lytic transglycosylase domain-containing protein [Fundidesulfovibrio agrisoli]